MITFTQLYQRAADNVGISGTVQSQTLGNIKTDINQALRLFQNQARRYTTRKEATTNLVQGQQWYTFPADMVRITTVRATSGGLTIPVTMIDSEELWNRINLIPSMTVGIPTQGFVRGRNELGLYPIPAINYTNGLDVSYESRMRDMLIDDTSTITATISNGSTTVVAATGSFTPNMVGQWLTVQDGSDGNWYLITAYTDSTHITLENYYQGPNTTAVACNIGTVPDIPEEYHLALVYFATYNYFLKRKDMAVAGDYKSLFDELFKEFKKVYAIKTTGVTQDDLTPYTWNLFGLPPQNVTA